MRAWIAGEVAGTGTFLCTACGSQTVLEEVTELPTCSTCGGEGFKRSSIFATAPSAMIELNLEALQPDWLEDVRLGLDEPGQYLAFRGSDGELQTHQLKREWTRIGRSLAADIRFDDPTVSRRHALIVRGPDGLRVLDDRSLNGVFVNGERVEWSALADGDEIVIGRHHLRFVEVAVVSGLRPGVPALRAPDAA
jgi:hypothetical protein